MKKLFTYKLVPYITNYTLFSKKRREGQLVNLDLVSTFFIKFYSEHYWSFFRTWSYFCVSPFLGICWLNYHLRPRDVLRLSAVFFFSSFLNKKFITEASCVWVDLFGWWLFIASMTFRCSVPCSRSFLGLSMLRRSLDRHSATCGCMTAGHLLSRS